MASHICYLHIYNSSKTQKRFLQEVLSILQCHCWFSMLPYQQGFPITVKEHKRHWIYIYINFQACYDLPLSQVKVSVTKALLDRPILSKNCSFWPNPIIKLANVWISATTNTITGGIPKTLWQILTPFIRELRNQNDASIIVCIGPYKKLTILCARVLLFLMLRG